MRKRESGRFLRRSGAPDIVTIGERRRRFGDLYHSLLVAPWWQFFAALVGGYLTANALFAGLYMLLPGSIHGARPGSFADAYFFSVQTMATIGYGVMSPETTFAHALVATEAFVGLMGFAMATGLMLAKFARPTARILFSRVAVVSPRDGVPSFMFRMANERRNQVADGRLHVVLARNEKTTEGEAVRRFYDLELSRDRTALFALTWTAIHPITEHSPLAGKDAASLLSEGAEVIVSFVGIDDTFAQTIHTRHSYSPEDIKWGVRLADILSRLPDGRRALDYTKFHDVVPVAGDATSDATREAGRGGG